MENTITSLFVSGIVLTTDYQYIYKTFSQFGKVHKINYKNTGSAHVHMRHWYFKTKQITDFVNKIKCGETVLLVHNGVICWNVWMYNPKKIKNSVNICDVIRFVKKLGINIQDDSELVEKPPEIVFDFNSEDTPMVLEEIM
jgi:hypothetical protein